MEIICSIGPRVNTIRDMDSLIKSGMTIPRFNFSHADYNNISKLIEYIKSENINIPIFQDLQGNKLRVSKKFIGETLVKRGERVIFSSENFYEKYNGTSKHTLIPIGYKENFKNLLGAEKIFMKDATMEFKIVEKKSDYIVAITKRGGVIRKEKGLNMPGINREAFTLSNKDKKDILWGIEHGVDIICVSYAAYKRDILEVRKYIDSLNKVKNFKYPKIWAKIECLEGAENIREILKEVDGIMIGRGDFRAEVDITLFPILQENIIKETKKANKKIVIATYILESLKKGSFVSLSEVNDIYNFIKQGVDGFMLAGEVSISNNAKDNIKFLKKLIEEYENQ